LNQFNIRLLPFLPQNTYSINHLKLIGENFISNSFLKWLSCSFQLRFLHLGTVSDYEKLFQHKLKFENLEYLAINEENADDENTLESVFLIRNCPKLKLKIVSYNYYDSEISQAMSYWRYASDESSNSEQLNFNQRYSS